MKRSLLLICICIFLISNLKAQTKTTNDSVLYHTYNMISGEWEQYRKTIYSFDADWKTTGYTEYAYSPGFLAWIPFAQNVYSTHWIYTWNVDSGNWADSAKYEYTDEGTIRYLWNKSEGQWEKTSLSVSVYNGWYEYIGSDYYEWDKVGQAWIPVSHTRQSFDNNSVYTETEVWNQSASKWENQERSEFYDNDDGDTGLVKHFIWDVANQKWVQILKDEYFYYDLTGTNRFYVEIITSADDGVSGTSFYTLKRTSYFTRRNLSDVENLQNEKYRIFHPVESKYLFVDIKDHVQAYKVEIFTLRGEKVFEATKNGSERFSTENLNAGLYIYRVNLSEKTVTGKFAVR